MVDAVISYVDSADKAWQAQYNKFVKRPLEEVENRFRSYGVLDLQIELIRKFMPFVEKVFVIVSSDSQVPNEVKNMEDVHIVKHREIIPKMFLPCFNSCTIEMFMHNIPGLAEHYLYFNDDMFPVSMCKESDFFIGDSIKMDYELLNYDEDTSTIFRHNVINSTSLFYKKHEILYNAIKPAHSVMPMVKSACIEVYNSYKEQILKSLTRTRHSKNINQYVFFNYMFKAQRRKKTKVKSEYFDASCSLEIVSKHVKNDGTKLVCINDNCSYIDFDEFKLDFRYFLECFLNNTIFVPACKRANANDKIYVTFTSWKNRINLCKHIVDLMMYQTLVPEKLILNLSEEEFPNKEKDLPVDLVGEAESNPLFEIYWVKENYKQFKKLVHTLDRFPNDIIISIDDDFPYPESFIETLYNDYIENGRNNPISYSDFVDKDGLHTHHGSFTITESKFYGEYLHKILDEFIYPNFNKYKCYDDQVYTEAAKLNGYLYKEGSVNYNKFRLELLGETIDAISKRTKDYFDVRTEYLNALKEFCETIKPNKLKVALCAIAKNENLYVREWVEWYKNLGISKIFLYDNNELDGERFEEVINDYIEEGFVEVIDVRGVEKGCVYDEEGINLQPKCYIEFYEGEGKNYDWICFFDIDEFLVFKDGYNLFNFLSQDIFKEVGTVLIPWKHYTDNNLIYYEDKPVMERFTIESEIKRYGVKSIVRSNLTINNKFQRNLIHSFILKDKKTVLFNGKKASYKNLEHMWFLYPRYIYVQSIVYLNHYKTKTIEEYLSRHLGRHWGTSLQYTSKEKNMIDCINEFFKYNDKTIEKLSYISQYEKINNL